MKRSLGLLLAAALLAGLLTACSKEEKGPENTSSAASVTAKVQTTAAELMSGEHFAMERASGWEEGGSQNAIKQKEFNRTDGYCNARQPGGESCCLPAKIS